MTGEYRKISIYENMLYWFNLVSILSLVSTGIFINNNWIGYDLQLKHHWYLTWVEIIVLLTWGGYLLISKDKLYKIFIINKKDIHEFWAIVKYYLYLKRDYGDLAEHNALQKIISYFFILLFALQVYSGLSLKWSLPEFKLFGLELYDLHLANQRIFIVLGIIYLYMFLRRGGKYQGNILFGVEE